MEKSEVYSWRLDRHLKEELEQAAGEENRSVGSLLTRIVREWLAAGGAGGGEDQQQRVREEATKYFGKIRGGDPQRAAEAGERVKEIVRRKHEGRRSD